MNYLTKVKSEPLFEGEELKGLQVVWIDWDSDFRNTEMEVGDIIVGINEAPITSFLNENGKISSIPTHYSESYYWETNEYPPSYQIAFDLIKKGRLVTVSGTLVPEVFYNDGLHRLLGPNGPKSNDNDGFRDSWSSWYERVVNKLQFVFDACWERYSFNNSVEFDQLKEEEKRLMYLEEHHPSLFTQELQKDFYKGLDILKGKWLAESEVDLSFREYTEMIQKRCKELAVSHWQAHITDHSLSEYFTPISLEDFDTSKTEVFLTPWLTYRNSIEDIGKGYFMVGDERNGFNHIQMNSEKMKRFYDTIFRYKNKVNPKVDDRFRFVGRIIDSPRMLRYRGRQYESLEMDPLYALYGDSECLVEIDDKESYAFVGEELTMEKDIPKPSTTSDPQEFMDYFFSLVKLGYRNQWEDCFSPYVTNEDFMGIRYLEVGYYNESSLLRRWDEMRSLIMDMIADIRVEKITYSARPIVNPEFSDVKTCVVWVDYFRKSVDGGFVSFKDVHVFRGWRLINIMGQGWQIDGLRGFR